MQPDKTLETYTGKNEKTKIVVKLQHVCSQSFRFYYFIIYQHKV